MSDRARSGRALNPAAAAPRATASHPCQSTIDSRRSVETQPTRTQEAGGGENRSRHRQEKGPPTGHGRRRLRHEEADDQARPQHRQAVEGVLTEQEGGHQRHHRAGDEGKGGRTRSRVGSARGG